MGVQAHTQILWIIFNPFILLIVAGSNKLSSEEDHLLWDIFETHQQEWSECSSQQFGALPERKSTLMIWHLKKVWMSAKENIADDHRLLAVVKKDLLHNIHPSEQQSPWSRCIAVWFYHNERKYRAFKPKSKVLFLLLIIVYDHHVFVNWMSFRVLFTQPHMCVDCLLLCRILLKCVSRTMFFN